jgi:UDP-glucose 4-epimerase
MPNAWFVVGGAGFIGSHFVAHLLADETTERVTAFDNFASGRRWHLEHHATDERFRVVEADVHDEDHLRAAMAEHDTVIHLASNPDIARAATDPDVDFVEGTQLTRDVLEAMRLTGASTILYASGSGVYGDLGDLELAEDFGPLIPISTYGASKLAGEALIAAYSSMFDLTGYAFRFGNVVGPRQTHGVGLDFIHRLLTDPRQLSILGDGQQSKSYVHVEDVVDAVLLARDRAESPYAVFNVATGDYRTVREIADISVAALGLDPADVTYKFQGGSRGWKGDVPIVRLNTARIRSLGWTCRRTSYQALCDAAAAIVTEASSGKTSTIGSAD